VFKLIDLVLNILRTFKQNCHFFQALVDSFKRYEGEDEGGRDAASDHLKALLNVQGWKKDKNKDQSCPNTSN